MIQWVFGADVQSTRVSIQNSDPESFCRVVTETIRPGQQTRPGLTLNTRLVPWSEGRALGHSPPSHWSPLATPGLWLAAGGPCSDLCTELTWTEAGARVSGQSCHMELHPGWCNVENRAPVHQGTVTLTWMNVKLWMKYVHWIVEYNQYWINAWSCKWMTDVCVLPSQQPYYHTIMRANDRAVNLSCLLSCIHKIAF